MPRPPKTKTRNYAQKSARKKPAARMDVERRSGAIPYEVSRPNAYWRIKKGLPADQYWKKRYWRRRITGRGDYTYSDSNSYGANLGGWLGSKAGEYLGGMAQRAIGGLVTGLGDYQVNKNVLINGNMPTVQNLSSGGDVVISFQEYLGDIVTAAHDTTTSHSSPFKIDSYLINAANSKTFPFLSQIAANFEQFEFEGILFGYRTTSGEVVTNDTNNLQLGTVIMATQYDVADPIFGSKGEMLNYQFSTSIKPSQPAIHMIECAPNQTPVNLLYTGTAPTGTDPRLYNLGRFSIATQGFQGSEVVIGELHVTYQVRLLKPKLWTNLGETIPYTQIGWDLAFLPNTSYLTVEGQSLTRTFSNAPNIQYTISSAIAGGGVSQITFNRQRTKIRIMLSVDYTGGSIYFETSYPNFTGEGITILDSNITPSPMSTNLSTTGTLQVLFEISPEIDYPKLILAPAFAMNTGLPPADIKYLLQMLVIDPTGPSVLVPL